MIGNCYKQLRPEEYYEIGAEDEVVVDDVVLEVPEEEVHVVTKNLELDLDFRENFWDGVDHDPQNFFSNFGEDAFANRNYNSGGGGGGGTSSGVRKQRYSVPN